MKHFIDAIGNAITSENYFAALMMALTLPDICGRLENPSSRSGARYINWFNQYMRPKYSRAVGADQRMHTFLSGEDCYALRCALLHQGEFDIESQSAQIALSNFHFIFPPGNGNTIHMNTYNSTLQLQVDIFCREICEGVDVWLSDVSEDDEIMQRMSKLGSIHRDTEEVGIRLS